MKYLRRDVHIYHLSSVSPAKISSRRLSRAETFRSIRDLVGRKLIRAGREKGKERGKERKRERPEATKLLYPTFILLFPASSPRGSIFPGPFPFRDARENNLESTLVAVKLHPKLHGQRHRKPIQRTTTRDIFPPFHASSLPPSPSLYELSGGGELWPVQEPVNRPVAHHRHESADPRLSVTYGTSPLAPWPNLPSPSACFSLSLFSFFFLFSILL